MQRFLGALVIVVIIIAVVGVYFDWFHFQKPTHNNDDTVTYSVEVNKAKIKEDTARLKEKVADATDGDRTVAGRIITVDFKAKNVTIETDENKEMTFHVETGTKIQRNNSSAALNEFRQGDRITVAYAVRDGQNIARSLTAKHSE